MSEKRFEVINARWQGKGEAVSFEDTQTNQVYFAENQEECERIVELLNEQQEFIEELQVSDEMGWKRAEHFEKKCPKELHNKKMYIKRLEYKVQKFKEENEQLKKQLSKYDKLKISIFNKDKGDWKWNDNNDIILNIRNGKSFYLRNSGAVENLVDLLNELAEENELLKSIRESQQQMILKLYEENEQLRMKLKGEDYIMVSEMLSNLRKTGICDDCKNKNKPVEWYLERGFSITGQICDRYEPE